LDEDNDKIGTALDEEELVEEASVVVVVIEVLEELPVELFAGKS